MIYSLLSLISWNSITSCLAVTGGGSVAKRAGQASPAGFWEQYSYTYLLISHGCCLMECVHEHNTLNVITVGGWQLILSLYAY